MPLGPMTSPILSTGILTVMIRGANWLISSGASMASAMTSRIVSRASRAWLQRRAEHLGRDAVELGVELEGGDELLGAGDLEVHVAERVLGTEDVGQRHVLGRPRGDEAHRDAGDRCPCSGTPALSSDSVDAQTEPIEVEPLEPDRLGDLTDRVRELLARRQHRHQRPLGERAVADLAPLGRADPAGLTGRVRREVVVVHVALGALGGERVELLLHPEHVQRGDAQDLGLAALEQRRAVHPRDDVDLGGQRPDVGQAAAVDAELVAEDPLADQLLVQRRGTPR